MGWRKVKMQARRLLSLRGEMLGPRGQRGMDGIQARLEPQGVMTGHVEEGSYCLPGFWLKQLDFHNSPISLPHLPVACRKDLLISVAQDIGHWTLNSYLLEE